MADGMLKSKNYLTNLFNPKSLHPCKFGCMHSPSLPPKPPPPQSQCRLSDTPPAKAACSINNNMIFFILSKTLKDNLISSIPNKRQSFLDSIKDNQVFSILNKTLEDNLILSMLN